jgi:hypothetical protein
MITLKLGKQPAKHDITFKFAAFKKAAALPTPPEEFGHEKEVKGRWGMLANDKVGDCVFAGAAHEVKLWNAECGTSVRFLSKNVLSDYSAVTGYNPKDESTDAGTDMREACSYRRKTGIVDANGVRHKIAAYMALEPGNLTELKQALYLFGVVGGGFDLPYSALDQFDKKQAWSVVPNMRSAGGHYVSIVGYRKNKLIGITWGRKQEITEEFYEKQSDEAYVMLSEEMLKERKSPEGFDYDLLISYLNAL